MHSLLFAVLGALLMQSMYGRLAARAGVGIVLALLLGVGLLQEGIQLFSEQRVLNYGNFFDIGVDMLGGGLGLLLTAGLQEDGGQAGKKTAGSEKVRAGVERGHTAFMNMQLPCQVPDRQTIDRHHS